MSLTYSYSQDFKSKDDAKNYAKKLRKKKRRAIVQKRSVGKKKYRYFVYATKTRK